MSDVWLTVGALTIGTAVIRASGPVLLGGRRLSQRFEGVVALFAPTLLAALVVVQTVGAPEGGAYEFDARIVGVGAAAVALIGGAGTLTVGVLAALVTALVRLIA